MINFKEDRAEAGPPVELLAQGNDVVPLSQDSKWRTEKNFTDVIKETDLDDGNWKVTLVELNAQNEVLDSLTTIVNIEQL